MIRGIFFSILLITFVFILNSCHEFKNPLEAPVSEEKELVPLEIGNSWSFKVTTYDTLGAISWIDTLTFYISKDTIINNLTWYLQGYDGEMYGQLGFRNDDRGYTISNFEGYYCLYPYPAEVGESIDRVMLSAKDSIIETSFGKLKCYIYELTFFDSVFKEIYAPGIGLIYQESPMKPFNSNTVYLIQKREMVSTNVHISRN